MNCRQQAPVAQLDRASASGAEGHRFESCRARQLFRPFFSTKRAFFVEFSLAVLPEAVALPSGQTRSEIAAKPPFGAPKVSRTVSTPPVRRPAGVRAASPPTSDPADLPPSWPFSSRDTRGSTRHQLAPGQRHRRPTRRSRQHRVRRLKQRRRETGEVAPRQQRYGRHPVLAPQLHTLAALIQEHPDRTLADLQVALGTSASLATIWRAVKQLGFTLKKL